MNKEPHARLLIRAERAYQEAVAEPAKGRRTAELVAGEARGHGADEALVVALRAAGWAAREQYDHHAARRHLDEAVQVARRSGFDDRLCEALVTRSAAHLEMGHARRARQDLEDAARCAGPGARIEVEYARGLLEDTVGNLDGAVDAYRRVLRLGRSARPDLRFKSMNNLGLVVLRLGRYAEADRLLADATALAATFSPTFAGHAADSRATAAIEQGRPVEAMRHYEEAERLLTKVGVHLVDLNLGRASAMLTLWLLEEAADAAASAVSYVEDRLGGSLMLAEALLPTAQIALARGDLTRAAEAAARAETLFRHQRRPGWRARAALLRTQVEWEQGTATAAMSDRLARIERTMRRIGNMPAVAEAALLHGRVAAAAGRRRRAVAALDRAAVAARGPALLRLRGRLATAMKADLEGNTRRVSHVCRVGLEELGAYRAIFASAELRARAAAHGAELGQLGLRAAVHSGRPETIWAWMERTRAVVAVREGSAGTDAELLPELAQLRGLERNLHDVAPDDASAQARLLRRIAQLERTIRNRSWTRQSETATLMMPSDAALRELRAGLDGCTLLQYAVLDGRVLGVAVSRGRLRLADVGAVEAIRGSGRQLAFALRRLSQPRSPASVAAAFDSARQELSRLDTQLTAPFTGAVHAADEVVVAPPAELIGVPWGALPLLAGRAVRVVPSAMLWQLTRQRTPRSDDVVLVAGPDLRNAVPEVEAIAPCYTGARVLTHADATVDAVRAAAAGARTVHFACHGRLRSDSAAFSSLQLHDGPLTVHDLEHLPRSAHHWVLAACDLGSPGQLVGPELDGVLATLLLGGAAGVVAAVVSVPDLETHDLMTDLHRALASGSPLSHAVQFARDSADVAEPTGFVASVAFSCYGGG